MIGSYVDLYVEIPEFYYGEIQAFLEKNPKLSQSDFFLLAASRYLSEKQNEEQRSSVKSSKP